MSDIIHELLTQYAIESGAVEVLQPEDYEELSGELLDYAIESVCREMTGTLSLITALNGAAQRFEGAVSQESFESYRQEVQGLLAVGGISIPVQVFVPSFEAAEKEEGSAKGKIAKLVETIRKWFAERFKSLRALLAKLKGIVTNRKAKAKAAEEAAKKAAGEMKQLGAVTIMTTTRRGGGGEDGRDKQSSKHGDQASADNQRKRAENNEANVAAGNAGKKDEKVRVVQSVAVPASFVKNGKIDIAALTDIANNKFGLDQIQKALQPGGELDLNKFSSSAEAGAAAGKWAMDLLYKKHPLTPTTSDWETDPTQLASVVETLRKMVDNFDPSSMDKELERLDTDLGKLLSDYKDTEEHKGEIDATKAEIGAMQQLIKVVNDAQAYSLKLLENLAAAAAKAA